MAEDTEGPKAISNVYAADDAFGALESAVLDRVSVALNKAAEKAAKSAQASSDD
jgi:hypothetical protein